MAATFFLDGEFENAELYYESIEEVAKECEEQYELNYGLTLAMVGKVQKALKFLSRQVNSEYMCGHEYF
jgi:hypothetical protein